MQMVYVGNTGPKLGNLWLLTLEILSMKNMSYHAMVSQNAPGHPIFLFVYSIISIFFYLIIVFYSKMAFLFNNLFSIQ